METPHGEILYVGESYAYITSHLAACFESSWEFHREFWDYHPKEKVTLFLNDFSDVGNAGAMVVPRNFVMVNVSPFDYTFDITPGNERFQWLMNHELTHVTMADQSAGSDRIFRHLFGGKIASDSANPLSSLLFGYLTAPRWYSPRWYHEGIAVFMETWMSGGLGRTLGGYDEMVFRAMVNDGAKFYKPIGLETEGTTIDFQVGMNAYLYGTRFVSYLAYTYGMEKLKTFYRRCKGSRMFYANQFKEVYGEDVVTVWDRWVEFEQTFQKGNLDLIREYPLTEKKIVTEETLGSVSRSHFDPKRREVYCAINRPGDVARLVAIHIDSGAIRKIAEVESPGLYYVTNIAYDPTHHRLFCTTKNSSWRGMKIVDLETGREETLFDYIRILEMVYSDSEQCLYGIQNIDGRHTIVKLEGDFTTVSRLHSIPFGKSLYNIDVSPDGKLLSGTMTMVDGRQELVVFNLRDLNLGKVEPQVIYEFEDNSVSNFTFSNDSRKLYGTSYYTGVSNVWEVDVENRAAELVSNTDIGFFRPIEISENELLVYEYNSQGLRPVIIEKQRLEDANSIEYLGMRVLEKNPELFDFKVKPVDLSDEELILSEGEYFPIKETGFESIYPILEGYRNDPSVGFQLNLSDPLQISTAGLRVSYSPDSDIPDDEKLHINFDYDYWAWSFQAGYNKTSFYDLFGPTYESFAGYYTKLSYEQLLVTDKPRSSSLTYSIAHFGNLTTLPGNQNVQAGFDKLSVASIHYEYSNLSKSLGALEYESGFQFSADAESAYLNDSIYPKLNVGYDRAFLTPIRNSSIWIRTNAGKVFTNSQSSYSKMYFGGFGNNYVDRLEAQRYRNRESFPGVEIDEISAEDYLKIGFEWNLPPIRFEEVGFLNAYIRHARLSVFQSNLFTNLSGDAPSRNFSNVGAQLDIELVLFSLMKSTLSIGYAKAFGEQDYRSDEFLISLKIL